MQITTTFVAPDRAAWRHWLRVNGGTATEIWLVTDDRGGAPAVPYLDAVEEAICFGWIDSIQKRLTPSERAQRFSPRRPRSNWTELNKARARRLIALGLMTDAGRATLPDLDAPFIMPADIEAALREDAAAWANFTAFPSLYRRVRVGYIDEQRRNPDEFARRLQNFLQQTARNQLFGNWNDGGRLSES